MPKKAKWTPPRGIRLVHRKEKKKPYFVAVYKKERGAYETFSFATEADQIRYARITAENRNVPPVDMAKWGRFCEFERKIGGIENLKDVERHFLNRPQFDTILLKDAVEQFVRDKGREGIDYGTVKRYDSYLGRFSNSFSGYNLTDFHEDDISEWIQRLEVGRKPMKPLTKDNYRKFLKTFFRWAVLKRFILDNPMDRVPALKPQPEIAKILAVEDGKKLFENSKGSDCIGRLALEAFAGLRYSSAKEITVEDLIFEEQGIHLPASKIKTRKRFYVDGFPGNLWDWLEYAPEECWALKPRQYQEAKRHAFIRAGIPHPRNCLRHSFATYHVAAFKNVGETATILCHTNLSMLNRHYRGMATHRQGVEWFEIRP